MLLRLLKSSAIIFLRFVPNHSCLWNAEEGCGYVSSACETLVMWAWYDEHFAWLAFAFIACSLVLLTRLV